MRTANVKYFAVVHPEPDYPTGRKFPYGVCGPFLDEKEADQALEKFKAIYPGQEFGMMQGNFYLREGAEETTTLLKHDQQQARQQLRVLSALVH